MTDIIAGRAKEQLFDFVCQHSEYSERTVRRAVRQLVSALACLHLHGSVHLDVRVSFLLLSASSVCEILLTKKSFHHQPENVLVDGNGEVKLVDLGEGVRRNAVSGSVLPPVSLEFAAPELVIGKYAGAPADMWSVGVFLYIFLR